jgi:hypothetical protein
MGASHHVQVVGIVARRGADGVVAPGHEDDIAVTDPERLVERAIGRVDAGEGPALRTAKR